jgi:hypothetical protein
MEGWQGTMIEVESWEMARKTFARAEETFVEGDTIGR